MLPSLLWPEGDIIDIEGGGGGRVPPAANCCMLFNERKYFVAA